MRYRPTYAHLALAWGVRYCQGGCGRSVAAHRRGFIGPFWTVHWIDRHPTRRGYRRFAYLVARSMRERTETIDPLHDWEYLWRDVRQAATLLRHAGIREPLRHWAAEAQLAAMLASRRGAVMPRPMRRWVAMTARQGPIPQRQLRRILALLIDAARLGRHAEARERLHHVLRTCHWNTPHVLHNIGAGRCRYIASLGYPVPPRFLATRPLGRRIR